MSNSISVLLPARGRPDHLRESVASCFELATDPDNVEVLIRLDDDDPHLDSELRILRHFGASKRIVVFTGYRLGYQNMHEMYGGLALHSEGDWLVNWNDDMQFITQGWDALLREAPPFSIQFPRRDTTQTTDYTVPVTGRSIFIALGHLSKNAYCDAWISDFSAFAGTSVIRDDIVFRHQRLDDQTLKDQGLVGGKEWAKFTTDEQKTLRRADMEKIMASPEWTNRFKGWEIEQVDHVGVDYINLAAGERKAGAVRLKGRKET